MKWLLPFITASCFVIEAFEYRPWFPEEYLLEATPSYIYSNYPFIEGSTLPSSHSRNSAFNLEGRFAFLDNWEVQLEACFLQSHYTSFNFQDIGVMGRYCLWDDLQGDPIRCVIGIDAIFVPTWFVHDPTSPYHAQSNFEASCSVGKEWYTLDEWKERLAALFAVGMANRGYPWIKADLHAALAVQPWIALELSGYGYFGFGPDRTINPLLFNGYANIAHRSIDIALKADLTLSHGVIYVEYLRRLYAEAYPSHLNAVTVGYRLLFNPF